MRITLINLTHYGVFAMSQLCSHLTRENLKSCLVLTEEVMLSAGNKTTVTQPFYFISTGTTHKLLRVVFQPPPRTWLTQLLEVRPKN